MKNPKSLIVVVLVLLGSAASAQNPSVAPAPTPTSDEQVTVATEEVKLNVTALDASGRFVADLKKEDLVIVEDDRLQQANAVRRSPAHVMLLLDTGGAMRGYLSATRSAAKGLVGRLAESDKVSVLQFGERAELLSGWTADKPAVAALLDRKLAFGKRSDLDGALAEAVERLRAEPLENRHLVLITGGTGDLHDLARREALSAQLLATDINVHVISFTGLELGAARSQGRVFNEGEWKPRRMPEEVADTLPDPKGPGKKKRPTQRDLAKGPRLGSVTLDVGRLKKARAAERGLEDAERFLEQLAADTNGSFFLPESTDDLDGQAETLANVIDSQYVVTYTPRRPVKGSPPEEVRQVRVSSRRPGVRAEAYRKLRTPPLRQ